MAKKTIPLKNELKKMHEKWKRVQVLIENDETSLGEDNFCLKLPNETAKAYVARKKLFPIGFVNPAIELLTAPANTIFRNEIKEDIGVKNTRLNMFLDNVMLGQENQVPLKQYMEETVCIQLRGYGTVFILMDMPRIDGKISEEAQKENRIWPYLNMIHPRDMINYEYKNGELLWIEYKTDHRDPWENPLDKEPKTEPERRVWTQKQYIRKNLNNEIIVTIDHNWGFVPMIIQASFKADSSSVIGESPFLTSSRYIIAANNHLDGINMELWKYKNALLLIHRETITAENSSTNSEGEITLKTIPDGSALIWAGEKPPDYLIRDLAVIEPTIKQYNLYMDSAIDNERSAKSVAKSGYSGSEAVKAGISLLIERDPILANIIATALDCQVIHKRAVVMADKMINDGKATVKPAIEYDMNYDIKPFKDNLANIKAVIDLRIPSETLTKAEYKKIADNEVKDLKIRKKVYSEIDAADVGEKVVSDEELENILTGEKKKVVPPKK